MVHLRGICVTTKNCDCGELLLFVDVNSSFFYSTRILLAPASGSISTFWDVLEIYSQSLDYSFFTCYHLFWFHNLQLVWQSTKFIKRKYLLVHYKILFIWCKYCKVRSINLYLLLKFSFWISNIFNEIMSNIFNNLKLEFTAFYEYEHVSLKKHV